MAITRPLYSTPPPSRYVRQKERSIENNQTPPQEREKGGRYLTKCNAAISHGVCCNPLGCKKLVTESLPTDRIRNRRQELVHSRLGRGDCKKAQERTHLTSCTAFFFVVVFG